MLSVLTIQVTIERLHVQRRQQRPGRTASRSAARPVATRRHHEIYRLLLDTFGAKPCDELRTTPLFIQMIFTE